LVGTGTAPNQTPLLILEPSSKESVSQEQQVVEEVQDILAGNIASQSIQKVVVYPTKLPTDIRHNSKIFREQLTEWANQKSL
jgi:hypothetical protein